MSENLEKYKDYLHLLPEEEKKAVEKALTIPDRSDSVANTVVRQMNRSKDQDTSSGKSPENTSETFMNDSKRLARVSHNRV